MVRSGRTLRVWYNDMSKETITTWMPKWLFLLLMEIHGGIEIETKNYKRFVPRTSIQRIDFMKEK